MTPTKSKIPAFKSIEEEAAFWDTHDTTDYEDEFKPVKMRVIKPLEHIFSVRLDSKTLTTLQHQADRKGMGTATLIRMLVKEGLEELKTRQVNA